MQITFLISGTDIISLESRPLNFRVFIHAIAFDRRRIVPVVANTRTKSMQKQILKSKYLEEYSTVDKVLRK